MRERIEDWFLRLIQRRCVHPDDMVASDVLEGCAPGIQVKWCRRCGAIKADWNPQAQTTQFISLEHTWRSPDPHLWRG